MQVHPPYYTVCMHTQLSNVDTYIFTKHIQMLKPRY